MNRDEGERYIGIGVPFTVLYSQARAEGDIVARAFVDIDDSLEISVAVHADGSLEVCSVIYVRADVAAEIALAVREHLDETGYSLSALAREDADAS